VNTKAAQETRELILTLRPDVVVLELDATHLATLIDAELNEALTCRRTTTLVDALGIVFSGRFDMFLYERTALRDVLLYFILFVLFTI
jgi:pheromone shutdown protein TraB